MYNLFKTEKEFVWVNEIDWINSIVMSTCYQTKFNPVFIIISNNKKRK